MADCKILSVPVWQGAGRHGGEVGPLALWAAGLGDAIAALGHTVEDMGIVVPGAVRAMAHPNPAVKALPEIAAWTAATAAATCAAARRGMPIVLGGDHSLSAGTLAGLARHAAELGRPLFVLWLDAHPDFHTLDTTESGNLHGVGLAYACGLPGFGGSFPPLDHAVVGRRVCALGIRSVDRAERGALVEAGVLVHDMRSIDEHGIGVLTRAFVERVEAENGLLHVSFDVDFLDPTIAPGVGTDVPGGATFREAHLVMELLHDSGRVTSLDLVELNPLIDERGRTASLMVDLVASLLGRSVFDRPAQALYRP